MSFTRKLTRALSNPSMNPSNTGTSDGDTNIFSLPNAFAPSRKRMPSGLSFKALVPWLKRDNKEPVAKASVAAALSVDDADEPRQLANKIECSLGDTVTAVAISRDCKVFAAVSTNKQAVVYSTEDGTLLARFIADAPCNAVQCLGVGEDMTIAVGTFNGNLRFYSVLQRCERLAVKFVTGGAVNAMACAKDDTRLCVGGQTGFVAIYHVDMCMEDGSFHGGTGARDLPTSPHISPYLPISQ